MIKLISDGVMLSDGGGAFGLVPRVKWSRLLPPDDHNRVPQVLWTPVIEVDGARILVDCGIGDKLPDVYETRAPRVTQIEQLAQLGLRPEDIDIVVLTHLHGDHAGWCTRRDASGELRATYPNARYYVQRREFDDATHPNERTRNTYFPDNYVPLQAAGVLTLLDGETQLTPSVRLIPSPGHTAGHQLLVVEANRTVAGAPPILILGELATYMIQFARLPWVTAYDVLPMQTIDSKRYWQRWAHDNHAIVLCSHEPGVPVARVVNAGGGFFGIEPASSPLISLLAERAST